MKIPENVAKYAKEHGFVSVTYAGVTNDGVIVYKECIKADPDGTFGPTGFPYILLQHKDGSLSRKSGYESLNILSSIDEDSNK